MKEMNLLLAASISATVASMVCAEAEDDIPNLRILSEFSTGWVRNFNPFIGGRGNFSYESLFYFDLFDDQKVREWLGTGYTLSDDLKVLTVNLREGVKWSDGEDFTADDVVFTFEYPRLHPEIDSAGLSSKVTRIVKLDDHTVEIHLATPNAFAAQDIIGEGVRIYPKHIWQSIEQPATFANENPVATGPFTEVKRFTPQVYVLCKNPHYWNEDLSVNCLEFPQFASNDAALEMMSKGEFDWAGIFIPDIERTYVEKNPNNHYWFPSNDGLRLTFNFETQNEAAKEAFENLDFRKAISLAMDRETMIMIGNYGYVSGGNPATGLPKSQWRWRDPEADKVWEQYYRYDLDAAKEALKSGGFKDLTGNGFVETPSGKSLKIKIQVPSGWTDWVNNTAIAAEGMRAIGINVTVITPEVNSYASSWESASFDMQFCANSVQSSMWKFYDYTMHSRYAKSNIWWSTGAHNYKSDDIDSWIVELGQTIDYDKQRELVSNIERHYAYNIVHVPLFYNSVWYEYNDARFTGWANEDNPFVHPAPWDGMSRMVHIMNLKPKK
ncbi:ABC transporter substrate-binding protein [Vibrio sp. WXL103]|uniref:ABC transporter substrate-binding protein n=1 Tax=Vibrio sp. WXL103 TaxID=3450710 RepID=UPI003EC8AAF6